MANRKKEINFIAAQKMLGKTGQTTSFEFILVVTVVVVAVAMVGWFLLQTQKVNEATQELSAKDQALDEAKRQQKENEKLFAEYRIALDENGNEIFKLNSRGEKVYQYDSINKVAEEVATMLDNAKNTSHELDETIDLTSAVLQIMIYGAKYYNCKIDTFSFSSDVVNISLINATEDNANNYYKFMSGAIKSPLTFDPTQYIKDVEMGNLDADGDTGLYKFSLRFAIYSDSLNFEANN